MHVNHSSAPPRRAYKRRVIPLVVAPDAAVPGRLPHHGVAELIHQLQGAAADGHLVGEAEERVALGFELVTCLLGRGNIRAGIHCNISIPCTLQVYVST